MARVVLIGQHRPNFGIKARLTDFSRARRSQIVNLLAGFVHQDEETMLEV
jgi:hypothetical protein